MSDDLLHLEVPALLYGPTTPWQFAARLEQEGSGAAVISFADETAHVHNCELALGLLSLLGPVVSVYPADGCWSSLEVRTDADPGRTHGVGENRLHMDLVDRELIPRYIALYCVRADPQGGGASALSDLWAAEGELTSADRDLLALRVFSYWADKGVHGVGASMDRFAVLPELTDTGAPIRFTSKMLPHLEDGSLIDGDQDVVQDITRAFRRLVDAAYEHRTTVRLRRGQMLVFDQWRYAHGRMPLGEGQEQIPGACRRLLKQTYVGDMGVGGGL